MSYWLGISNTVIYLLIYSIFLLHPMLRYFSLQRTVRNSCTNLHFFYEFTCTMYMYFIILEICCLHIPSDLVLVAPKGTGWLRTRDFHSFLFLSLFYTSPQVRFMSEFLFISLPLCCSWSVFSPFSCWGPS